MRHLKIPLDRIDVLSVGIMGSEAAFTDSLGKGLAGWAPASADLLLGAATLVDSFLGATCVINQQTPAEIKLGDAEVIDDTASSRGSNVGQDSLVALRSRFLDGIHVPDWRLENP